MKWGCFLGRVSGRVGILPAERGILRRGLSRGVGCVCWSEKCVWARRPNRRAGRPPYPRREPSTATVKTKASGLNQPYAVGSDADAAVAVEDADGLLEGFLAHAKGGADFLRRTAIVKRQVAASRF